MADDGATGVLDLPTDTAEVEETTPEAAELAETTTSDDSVETVERPEGTAETETDEADPFAGLDEAALRENARIKTLLEKERKFGREQAEDAANQRAQHAANEARHNAELAQYNQVAQNQHISQRIQDMRQALGDPDWMPDQPTVTRWQQEAAPFIGAGRAVAKQEVVTAANEILAEVNPDYRVPAEMLDEWNRAAVAPGTGPLAKAALKVALAAALDKERDKLRAEIEAELADAQKTETARGKTSERKAAPRPTNVAGGAPPATDHSRVLSSSTASPEQKRAAFKALYGFDPD